ncbi:hypothetical protein H4R33_003160 [Dimargaris cristalligena]|uniref:Glutathione S-transferase n=1 Tax=Dimargaris cristalligena TaxID=215637 RepID=A0A4P9ZM07_9FUNG|nr:hypothetical protein H4R33_003160 [Dimargaris cristalligena]RKP34203.1 hypothetical protein BJ085DRAFT_39382 [Dimargaris cristalligena]|eukprot:RKP34203.1 hypothetical protein BJ085DRAFT_39382 [Dimargaris cristalligena]
MSRFEVHYVPATGRAEISRAILEYANADYQSTYPTDWAAEKSQTPFGQLPVLKEYEPDSTEPSFVLPDSDAIQRYLAARFGLYGTSPADVKSNAQQDAVLGQWKDVMEVMILAVYVAKTEEEKAAKFEKLGVMAAHLYQKHDELLLRNGTGHYVGNKTTLADIVAYMSLERLATMPIYKDTLEKHVGEGLRKFKATIEQDPAFKRYQERAVERLATYTL